MVYAVQKRVSLLLSSYLSDWRQRVALNYIISEWVQVLAGVPQGSILCPLLFILRITF